MTYLLRTNRHLLNLLEDNVRYSETKNERDSLHDLVALIASITLAIKQVCGLLEPTRGVTDLIAHRICFPYGPMSVHVVLRLNLVIHSRFFLLGILRSERWFVRWDCRMQRVITRDLSTYWQTMLGLTVYSSAGLAVYLFRKISNNLLRSKTSSRATMLSSLIH